MKNGLPSAVLMFLSLTWSGAWASIPDKSSQPVSVSAKKVIAEDLFDILSYPARISPKVNTAILAESDGVVAEVRAPLGQEVQAKERILKIQHTDPIYRYAPVWVTSPVEGVVSSVEVSQGSYVSRGQKLATVTDPRQVRITVEIPASDLSMVSKGQVGQFRLPGRDTVIPVIVHGVSPFVDPSTGTASCELEVTSDQAAHAFVASGSISSLGTQPKAAPLLAGLIGQVVFQVNQRKGVSVPEPSVVYRGKETFVRVIKDGHATKVAVILGKRIKDRYEILKGLEDGSVVVERSTRFLADGEAVEIQGGEEGTK